MEIGTHLKTVKNTSNIFAVWFKSSWLKSLGLKGPGLKFGVEKSGVEMSFNLYESSKFLGF